MEDHGQVRPPTHETVPEMPTSYHEFFDSIADLTHAIEKLTREVQDIVTDLEEVQKEKRDDLTSSILKRKFRLAMREHDREAQ